MGKKICCPKCKGTNVQLLGGKTKTTLNLNPLKPFTLVNHKPTGKQTFQCLACGRTFEQKI